MVHTIWSWICGALCVIFLVGCVPHPVYRSSDKKSSSRSRSATVSKKTSKTPPITIPPSSTAHPVDPEKISTRNAYQIGMSSFYGKELHGRKTANGEIFNMYKLTAAHRVLPLGTIVRVTHLDNGRWVDVKVNDRGPFIEGRILDLSFAAALELEMVKAGTAKVMIEIIKPVE